MVTTQSLRNDNHIQLKAWHLGYTFQKCSSFGLVCTWFATTPPHLEGTTVVALCYQLEVSLNPCQFVVSIKTTPADLIQTTQTVSDNFLVTFVFFHKRNVYNVPCLDTVGLCTATASSSSDKPIIKAVPSTWFTTCTTYFGGVIYGTRSVMSAHDSNGPESLRASMIRDASRSDKMP